MGLFLTILDEMFGDTMVGTIVKSLNPKTSGATRERLEAIKDRYSYQSDDQIIRKLSENPSGIEMTALCQLLKDRGMEQQEINSRIAEYKMSNY